MYCTSHCLIVFQDSIESVDSFIDCYLFQHNLKSTQTNLKSTTAAERWILSSIWRTVNRSFLNLFRAFYILISYIPYYSWYFRVSCYRVATVLAELRATADVHLDCGVSVQGAAPVTILITQSSHSSGKQAAHKEGKGTKRWRKVLGKGEEGERERQLLRQWRQINLRTFETLKLWPQ